MAYSRELEHRTLGAMISIYCRNEHKTERDQLCSSCSKLLKYAGQRIDKCIYGDNKPVCSKCPVHCYNADMRDKVKKVMQYSGPRMLRKHPLLTARYFYRKLFKSKVRKGEA